MSDTSNPVLDVRRVVKRFGDHVVLDGVDLRVYPGEVVCLVGPSGSGKSTLLRCINHLERIDAGSIRLAGELVGYEERDGRLRELKEAAIARGRRQAAMVFQHFNLFAHLTALENVTLGPREVLGVPRAEADAEARRLLTLVGLGDRTASLPRQLSGGQRQRVAIARALAMKPAVILFDEPTSALDPQLVGEVLTVIRSLADQGLTMVIVTHELRFAREVADRVVVLMDGVIVDEGAPGDVLDDPVDPRIAAFVGMLGNSEGTDVQALGFAGRSQTGPR